MLRIHNEVQLESKPLQDVRDTPLVVFVLLAPAFRLRKAFGFFLLRGALVPLAPCVQAGRIAGHAAPKIRHTRGQAPRHGVEQPVKKRAMWFPAQDFKKARDIPFLRNPALRLNADHLPKSPIASQILKTCFEGLVPQRNRQQHDAPQGGHRIVVSSVPSRSAKRFQKLCVGYRSQERPHPLQAWAVFQRFPVKDAPDNWYLHCALPSRCGSRSAVYHN